jgi:hypothetical protein
MLFALCGSSSWKDFLVQSATVLIPFSLPDGDAIAAPFWTSSLNPNFPSKKF